MKGSINTGLGVPRPPTAKLLPPQAELVRRIPTPSGRNPDATFALFFKAAWALTLRKFSGSNDVSFGQPVAGRSCPVPDVMDIMGPTVDIVPARVRFGERWTMKHLLGYLKEDHIRIIPNEGFSNLAVLEQCTDWKEPFKSVILYQNIDLSFATSEPDPMGIYHKTLGTVEVRGSCESLDMWVSCYPAKGVLNLYVLYDPNKVPMRRAERIVDYLENLLLSRHWGSNSST
jgi:hypothetical protein